jgi:hypothetical protein
VISLKIKIPSKKHFGRQRCAEGFNSGLQGLTEWFFKPWWKVFTARYGLIAYIKQIYNLGGKCLQRGTD